MRARMVVALIALLVSKLANAQSTVVGHIGGQFTVSQTGAASYQIPISLPPGPRGMQPNLSLVYNSQSGAGMLGPGWQIAGLSSISRCKQTFAQDAAPAAIALNFTDRFCLDGQRLRLTSSQTLSTYGQESTTYQTEVANFSNVTASGEAGFGPAYFTVQAKNGLTYEYGNVNTAGAPSNGSQVLAPGTSTAVQWLLDKVSDRYGNNYVITYSAPNAAEGVGLPTTISYTPSSAGSTSYNYTVTFSYQARVTQNPSTHKPTIAGNVAGSSISNPNLLSSIAVSVSGTTVRTYSFGYTASATTTQALLTGVTECGGTAGTNCLAPTTIAYQAGSPGVQSAGTALASGSLNVLAVRDFNGDGREDVLYDDANSNVYVAFSTGSGFSAPVLLTTLSATSVLAYGDVLGKGQNDILVSVSNVWWRYSWNGSAFVGTSTGIALDAGVTYAALIDINGDGLADLVTATAGNLIAGQSLKIYSRLNTSTTGTLSFSSTESVTTLPPCAIHTSCFPLIDVDGGTASTLRSLDFNGDGMKDIVVRMLNQQTGHVFYDNYILASNGTSFNVPTPVVTNNTAPYIYLNANNDACTDIAQTTSLYLAYCNGTATGSAITLSGSAVGAMDWDGDGLDDVLVANGTTLGVIASTGSGTTAAITSTTIPYSIPTIQSIILATPFDQNGDGLADVLVNNNGNLSYYLHNGAGTPPDLVSKITDGYGNSVSPSYGYLTQAGSLYLNFTDATFPYKNYIGPLYVVSTTTFSDPSSATGGTYTQTMSYYGAWMNLQGRGFSGFDEIGNLDSRNGVWEVKFYRRDFPYTGRLSGDWISQSNTENSFSVKENNTFAVTNLITTANNQSFFPYVSNSTSSYYELGGPENADLITTTSTNYTFDNYGNATNIVKTVTDNDPGSPYSGNTWTTSITNTTDISANQSADLAAWCLNMLDETQVTYSSSLAGATSVTRTKMFTPDTPSNCRIQSIITEPTANSGLYKVTEAFTFDSFGNLATDILTGAHMPASPASRETQLNWGTTGQFVNSVTDPSNATTSFTYASTQSLTFGLPDSVKDANNLTTSWAYDTLGRKTKETRPDGTSTTWTWAFCAAACGWSDSEYQVAQTVYQTNGTTPIRTDTSFFDPIDRVTEISGPTVTGSTAIVQKLYNSLGLLTQQSIPFLSGGTAYQTSYSYDVLNRISSVSRPTSSTNSAPQSTQYAYVGRKTTITDPLGNTKTTITDVKGGLRQTKDGIGYNITRMFDAAESLTGVTDSVGNTLLSGVTIVYGLKPFRTASTDADLGSWLFSIDSLGEKTGWTDAKGQVFSETYDALSRPLTRTDPDLFTQWTYGSTPGSFNVGQLIAECTGTGTACNASGYSESRTFDSFGRPSTRAITQGSNPGNDPGGVFLFTSAYSATTGMPLSLTYPISTSTVALKLQYAYSNGLLQSVTDVSDTTAICGSSCTLWTANAMNSFGEITQEALGNGVVTNRTFDAVTSWLSAATAGVGGGAGLLNQSYAEDKDGNIIERQNNTLGLTENFFYDADNRLTCATLASSCSTPTFVYDNGVAGPGNKTTQVGVGTYGYPAAGQPHPHAVTSLTGTFNGITNPSFSYDANGNMTNRASSGVNVTWSSYNYPITISGSDATGSEEVQFLYGPDRQRWKQIYTGPTGTETTYYIGGLVDMVFTGGVANYRHYIYAGAEPVAVYSRTASGVNTMSYMVEDHQGGIANIASKAGTLDISESFSAFGLRRNPTSWSGAPVAADLTTIAGLSRQGYTFQTWLGQSMGLNHMNGRVQDAILGRFLSPDPHVTDPSNAQSYNRYSYVNNNPLSATDPTGFDEIPDPNDQDQGSGGVGGNGGIGTYFQGCDAPTGSLICGPSAGNLTIICNTQPCSNALNAANYPAQTGASVGATAGDTTSAPTLANAAAQSQITGDSGLGNALRGVPLVGGFLGAAGDILSGLGNIGFGAITFNGGELASGFSELGGGIGSVFQIGFTDLAATLIGAGAYAYNNVRNAVSVLTLGNVFGDGNVLDSLKNLAWTAAIPDYAFNGGPMWSNPSSSLNYVDSISITHDAQFGAGQPNASANWVGAGWSSLPSGQVAPGLAGIGYVLLGTIPFLISNAVLGY